LTIIKMRNYLFMHNNYYIENLFQNKPNTL